MLLVFALACAPQRYEGQERGDCSDNADNDADGDFDCADEGCAGAKECKTSSSAKKPAEAPKEAKEESKELPPSDLGMVLIPAGTFTMGSPETEEGRYEDEVQHQVTLTRSFYIMEAEVTQGLWKEVMGSNPSHFDSCGDSCPVETVSWYDAVEFSNRLSDRNGLERCYTATGSELVIWSGYSCRGYRLPTEAEWEYAARGKTMSPYIYAGSDNLDEVGWYLENSGDKPHPVCGKKRNGYGLCDMSGNVLEWVWDWKSDYPKGSVKDPKGPSSGSYRVLRGGSWPYDAGTARVALRFGFFPGDRNGNSGFRLSRSAL